MSDAPTPTPVNDVERAWIDENLAALRSAGVDILDPDGLGAYADRQLTDWLAVLADVSGSVEVWDPNPVVNRIGIGLGALLIDQLGLEWGVVSDEHGTDLAVYDARSTLTLFPCASVCKRWSDRETGWVPAFVAWAHGFLQQVDDRTDPAPQR